MNEKRLSVGIDISKLTLDICLVFDKTNTHFQIKNDQRSIKAFVKQLLKKYSDYRLDLCMENTGLYNWPLFKVCDELGINLFVLNPLHLKKSMGLVREKSDKIDAQSIALYACRYHDVLVPYKIPSSVIRKIQIMLALRTRIVTVKKMFNSPLRELAAVTDKADYKEVQKLTSQTLKHLADQLKKVETELEKLIQSDQSVEENYRLMTSVQGVGKVLAWYLLVKTNNFTRISAPRKLACFVGVVPFKHQSGTSIYRKPRVSLMADKQVKKVLHMAAMRAIQLEGDLQQYYIRKVSEGKNKMLVLNAVRNKIIARICAVIKNKKEYQINLVSS